MRWIVALIVAAGISYPAYSTGNVAYLLLHLFPGFILYGIIFSLAAENDELAAKEIPENDPNHLRLQAVLQMMYDLRDHWTVKKRTHGDNGRKLTARDKNGGIVVVPALIYSLQDRFQILVHGYGPKSIVVKLMDLDKNIAPEKGYRRKFRQAADELHQYLDLKSIEKAYEEISAAPEAPRKKSLTFGGDGGTKC
jgi:hypothetical protein